MFSQISREIKIQCQFFHPDKTMRFIIINQLIPLMENESEWSLII